MKIELPKTFVVNPDVSFAQCNEVPVVALESTVITHGLPFPENLNLALEMEQIIRNRGAVPATIGVIDGKIHIGLNHDQLLFLACGDAAVRKISGRDFGIALARKENGGTTVAGTLIAAHWAGINVFATGGIGGVHRGTGFDVSADLPELGKTPLIVVCAGAKAILDLPATLEYLEMLGVPVLGYQTDEFPGFYSRISGLKVTVRVNSPLEAADIALAQWNLHIQRAVLVANPLPEDEAILPEEMEGHIKQALKEANEQEINGYQVTPFLLKRINELSGGKSLKANLALLYNNARIGAEIAVALHKRLSADGVYHQI
jgi:pseudouridine-5'-phosphate glycosidase